MLLVAVRTAVTRWQLGGLRDQEYATRPFGLDLRRDSALAQCCLCRVACMVAVVVSWPGEGWSSFSPVLWSPASCLDVDDRRDMWAGVVSPSRCSRSRVIMEHVIE